MDAGPRRICSGLAFPNNVQMCEKRMHVSADSGDPRAMVDVGAETEWIPGRTFGLPGMRESEAGPQ